MIGNDLNGFLLQKRDRHLLEEIGVMSVIDREMARRVAPFRSVSRANARLHALVRAGLLQRFFTATEAGGRKGLYTLSPTGARLVGASATSLRRKADEIVVADLFVAHQSGVNELYCSFKYGPAGPDGTHFVRWRSFSSVLDRATPLIPDGYVECDGPNAFSAFLEVDLGHERVAVWQGKVRHYVQYALSGRFTEQFGKSRFFVLAVCDSEGRMQSVRKATAQLTGKIFRFAAFSQVRERGPWAPVWWKPAGNEPEALVSIQ
jgi:Replication-relaxation